MIEFAHPWAFALIVPIALLALLMMTRRRPAAAVSSTIPFRSDAGKRHHLTLMEAALLLALLTLTAALARPRRPADSRLVRAQGVDIVLAIDMSASMKCIDRPRGMSEKSFVEKIESGEITDRMETAKQEIRRFIEARPNDRIGLIGFADLAYTFVPPTLDHQLLLERLKTLQAGELGNATGIASPIGDGVRRLKNSAAPRRVLVLFTDGENTADNAVTPQAAAEAAKEFNVIIHTVGIGSDQSYGITPSGRLARAPNVLDVKLLRELAGITGGTYFAAADGDGLRRVMDEINALEKTDHDEPRPLLYREYAPAAALIAAGLLLLGIILSCVGRLRLP